MELLIKCCEYLIGLASHLMKVGAVVARELAVSLIITTGPHVGGDHGPYVQVTS